jgi:hypothetical protein
VTITLLSTIIGQAYINTAFWILVGLGTTIACIWLIRHSSDRETDKIKNEGNKRLRKLIKDGIKLTVDLSECEIISNGQQIEQRGLDYLDETEAIDIILNSGQNQKQAFITQSSLVYKHKSDTGQIIKFYGPTNKDKGTLQILCAIQKSTSIYLDKYDPEIYYFDLRFLD